MNCGERNALAALVCTGPPAAFGAPATTAGRRTSSDAGISSAAAATPMISCAVRQPWFAMSQLANGATVIGATASPAETSDTANARCLSNHNVTVAIIGAMKLPPASPISTP